MKLYHGSDCVIEQPDIAHSRDNLDFGRGFYLTSFEEQAERWALRKAVRKQTTPIVNVYDFDDSHACARIRRFDDNDAAWVEFVCACRRGEAPAEPYDLIVGGVADDKVFRAVDMYFRGIWDIDKTLEALRFFERNDQYCFASQAILDDSLRFIGSYEVPR